MPDLDQIKQEEQERGTGAGGFPRDGRAIPPAGHAAAATRAPISRGCLVGPPPPPRAGVAVPDRLPADGGLNHSLTIMPGFG